jgi:hypothetical protein
VFLVVATLAVGGWLTAKGVRTLCAPSTSAKASCHSRLAPPMHGGQTAWPIHAWRES